MDGFNEKKWFVYITDHHEGPFSLNDVQSKMDQGEISTSHYVWCEGMADWRPMKDIQAFESLAPAQPATPPLPPPQLPQLNDAPSIAIAMEPVPAPMLAMAIATPMVSATPTVSIQAVPLQNPHPSHNRPRTSVSHMTMSEPNRGSSGGWFKTVSKLIVLIALGGSGYWAFREGHLTPVAEFAQPYLLQLADKFPALQAYISPIPKLADVDPEEYAELRKAASQPFEKGAAASVALSRANPEAPEFYVGGNLPDGTGIDITVEGISDTLLNQMSFGSQLRVGISKKLGKSKAVRFPDGRPMPRGQYKVTVKSGQLTLQRSYFLGGAKDATYTQRLKEFHDRLMEKSKNELAEVEQFTMTLEAQLGSTFNQFQNSRKKRVSGKKEWIAFATNWKAFSEKLNETFAKWSPDALKTEYFHGALFGEVLSAAGSIQRVHQAQTAFFTDAKVDQKSFDIQMGESVSVAKNTLVTLKSRLEKLKATPPSPNGMPPRENL